MTEVGVCRNCGKSINLIEFAKTYDEIVNEQHEKRPCIGCFGRVCAVCWFKQRLCGNCLDTIQCVETQLTEGHCNNGLCSECEHRKIVWRKGGTDLDRIEV